MTTVRTRLLDVKAWLENVRLASRPDCRLPPQPPPPLNRRWTDADAASGSDRIPCAIPRADSGAAYRSQSPFTTPVFLARTISGPEPRGSPREFTRAFQLPNPATSPPQPEFDRLRTDAAERIPARVKTAGGPAPGEFTRAFQIPNSSVASRAFAGSDGQPPDLPKRPPDRGSLRGCFSSPDKRENRAESKAPELGLPPSPPDTRSPSAPPAESSPGFFGHPRGAKLALTLGPAERHSAARPPAQTDISVP